MEETPNTSGELDHLRRRRGHRRGQITKLRNKVQDMQEAHPDTFDLILIDELLADLHTQVSAIEDLQEKIDFIYEAHPDLAIDEEPEKDRLDDAHKALKCTLLTLKKAGPLSHDCNVLLGQIQEAASKPQPESPRFCALVDSLRSRLPSPVPRVLSCVASHTWRRDARSWTPLCLSFNKPYGLKIVQSLHCLLLFTAHLQLLHILATPHSIWTYHASMATRSSGPTLKSCSELPSSQGLEDTPTSK